MKEYFKLKRPNYYFLFPSWLTYLKKQKSRKFGQAAKFAENP